VVWPYIGCHPRGGAPPLGGDLGGGRPSGEREREERVKVKVLE